MHTGLFVTVSKHLAPLSYLFPDELKTLDGRPPSVSRLYYLKIIAVGKPAVAAGQGITAFFLVILVGKVFDAQ